MRKMIRPRQHAPNEALAFTLIELLIVVAIIAILAAIAVPNFLEAQTRSKVSRAKADMRSIATAIEAFHVDHRRYPTNLLPISVSAANSWARFSSLGDPLWTIYPGETEERYQHCLTTPIAYLSSAPSDPFLNSSINLGVAGVGTIAQGEAAWQYGVDALGVTDFNNDRQGGERTYWCLQSIGPALNLNARPFAGGNFSDSFRRLTAQRGVARTIELFRAGDPTSPNQPYAGSYDPTNGTVSVGYITRSNIGNF